MTQALATRAEPQKHQVLLVPGTRRDDPGSVGLAKVTADGIVKAVRCDIKLDPRVGHTYDLGDKGGGLNISAAGYDHINKALGVSVYMPETLIGDDDKRHSNPWVTYDETGTPSRITVRIYGVGRNSAGNWQVVASTLHYELGPMLAQDALKKWREWVDGPKGKRVKVEREWGQLFNSGSVPEEVLGKAKRKSISIPGGYVLSVDLTSSEVLDLIENHNHRIRFCQRNAETIARRRVLKVFVGQQKLSRDCPSVSITAWPLPDRENVHDLERIVQEAQSGSLMIEGEKVEMAAPESSIDDVDEVDAELGAESDDDSPPEHEESAAPIEATPEPDKAFLDSLSQRRDKIEELAKQVPSQIVQKCLSNVGLEGLSEVRTTGELQLLEAAVMELQSAVGRRKTSKAGTTSGKGKQSQGELLPGADRADRDPG